MRRWLALAFLTLSLASPARAEFGVFTGAHFGFSQEGRDTNDFYQKRSMGVIDLQAMPGWHFGGKTILAGLLFDVRLLSQLSNVDTNAVGDFGGMGLLLGPGVAFNFSFGRALLSYDMRARQSINSPDATFKGSGFHFLVGYKPLANLSVDFEYVATRYNAYSTALADADLSAKPVSCNVIGVGASILF
ncbi:MAG: hypothetical protein ACXVB9_06480 [Bdellovibrionota bacterium]